MLATYRPAGDYETALIRGGSREEKTHQTLKTLQVGCLAAAHMISVCTGSCDKTPERARFPSRSRTAFRLPHAANRSDLEASR
jgi:hypothetical protein